jgi:hypothetical protein
LFRDSCAYGLRGYPGSPSNLPQVFVLLIVTTIWPAMDGERPKA